MSNRRQESEGSFTLISEQTLREIARRIPDLRWATIASINGLVQTTYDPFGKERPDRISAMVSAVLTLGRRVFRKLQHGRLTYLAMAGAEGMLVVHPVGGEYVLAVSTPIETEVDATVNALAQVAPRLASALYPSAR